MAKKSKPHLVTPTESKSTATQDLAYALLRGTLDRAYKYGGLSEVTAAMLRSLQSVDEELQDSGEEDWDQIAVMLRLVHLPELAKVYDASNGWTVIGYDEAEMVEALEHVEVMRGAVELAAGAMGEK